MSNIILPKNCTLANYLKLNRADPPPTLRIWMDLICQRQGAQHCQDRSANKFHMCFYSLNNSSSIATLDEEEVRNIYEKASHVRMWTVKIGEFTESSKYLSVTSLAVPGNELGLNALYPERKPNIFGYDLTNSQIAYKVLYELTIVKHRVTLYSYEIYSRMQRQLQVYRAIGKVDGLMTIFKLKSEAQILLP